MAPLRPGEGMTKGGLWKEAWKIQIKQNCFKNLKLVSAYLYVFCHRKPRLETKVNYLRHNGCHQYQNVPEAVWRLKDSILWTWNGLENFLCKEICGTWIKTYLVFHKTIQRKRVLEFEEGWLRQITNSYKDTSTCMFPYISNGLSWKISTPQFNVFSFTICAKLCQCPQSLTTFEFNPTTLAFVSARKQFFLGLYSLYM